MRRTLQTAQLTLDWLTAKGIRIQAHAGWQENSSEQCDTGSPVREIEHDFPGIDFSTVDAVWPDKSTSAGNRYAYTKEAILARGKSSLEELKQRPEKIVFIVTHSAFLRLGVVGYWWQNADYRIFQFTKTAEAESGLKQDESTLAGGLGLSWAEPVKLGLGLP